MKDKHTVILEELTIAGMRCERIKKMDFLSRRLMTIHAPQESYLLHGEMKVNG